jgi:hypothetical protein
VTILITCGGGVGWGAGGLTTFLGTELAVTGLPQLVKIAKANSPFFMTTKASKELAANDTLVGRI